MIMGKLVRSVILIIFLGIAGISTSCYEESKEKPKSYGVIDIGSLIGDLRENAALAKKRYLNTNWVIKGQVLEIDSDGECIVLRSDEKYLDSKITCLIDSKNQNLLDSVLKIKTGQLIRVFGTFSVIDQNRGYVLSVDKIERIP